MPTYPFTEEEFKVAADTWGCNCGPTALAFALQTTLEAVRHAIPEFANRGYTSPLMMREALAFFSREIAVVRAPKFDDMFGQRMAMVRIQWTGPWTDPKPARWAARYTHWIATWTEGGVPFVFDCNGGIMVPGRWENEIAPAIIATYKNANGWKPANVWRLA